MSNDSKKKWCQKYRYPYDLCNSPLFHCDLTFRKNKNNI